MACSAKFGRRVVAGSAVVGMAVWLAAAPAGAAPLYRSIDGMGNNIANPNWGKAGTSLFRLSGADYGDGISTMAGQNRPSARAISNGVSADPGPTPNSKGASDMLWQWGQFLDHDIDLTPAHDPAEYKPVTVPTGDPSFDPFSTGMQEIPLDRSIYDTATGTTNPRQQLNQITSFIDASNVYGSDALRATTLRTNDGTGQMRTSAGNLLPFNTSGLPNAGGTAPTLFLAGDERANEQVGLTALHTVFMREHNRLATEIATDNPGFTGEQIYQEARKMVGAMMQSITYNEFLPMILGSAAPGAYTGYDANVNPSIANAFSTAAYRFGHSMLSDTLLRIDGSGTVTPLALAAAFFNPSLLQTDGIEPFLRGLTAQTAQEIDPFVVDGVRNFLFGPPGAGGLDLASLNIQRGRDHGLPGYNDMRAAMGLAPITSYSEISSDPVIVALLEAVYGQIGNVDLVDDVDLWVGGLGEDHINDGMMGELFSAILADQFERLRVGDRFWFENDMFEDVWMDYIESSTLSKIITRNTDVSTMQANAFLVSEPGTVALFALGLAAVTLSRRRRHARR